MTPAAAFLTACSQKEQTPKPQVASHSSETVLNQWKVRAKVSIDAEAIETGQEKYDPLSCDGSKRGTFTVQRCWWSAEETKEVSMIRSPVIHAYRDEPYRYRIEGDQLSLEDPASRGWSRGLSFLTKQIWTNSIKRYFLVIRYCSSHLRKQSRAVKLIEISA